MSEKGKMLSQKSVFVDQIVSSERVLKKRFGFSLNRLPSECTSNGGRKSKTRSQAGKL